VRRRLVSASVWRRHGVVFQMDSITDWPRPTTPPAHHPAALFGGMEPIALPKRFYGAALTRGKRVAHDHPHLLWRPFGKTT